MALNLQQLDSLVLEFVSTASKDVKQSILSELTKLFNELDDKKFETILTNSVFDVVTTKLYEISPEGKTPHAPRTRQFKKLYFDETRDFLKELISKYNAYLDKDNQKVRAYHLYESEIKELRFQNLVKGLYPQMLTRNELSDLRNDIFQYFKELSQIPDYFNFAQSKSHKFIVTVEKQIEDINDTIRIHNKRMGKVQKVVSTLAANPNINSKDSPENKLLNIYNDEITHLHWENTELSYNITELKELKRVLIELFPSLSEVVIQQDAEIFTYMFPDYIPILQEYEISLKQFGYLKEANGTYLWEKNKQELVDFVRLLEYKKYLRPKKALKSYTSYFEKRYNTDVTPKKDLG